MSLVIYTLDKVSIVTIFIVMNSSKLVSIPKEISQSEFAIFKKLSCFNEKQTFVHSQEKIMYVICYFSLLNHRILIHTLSRLCSRWYIWTLSDY